MFKIQKLLNNMDENISRGYAQANSKVTREFESGNHKNTKKKCAEYLDREISIMKGNRSKVAKEIDNTIKRWK
jgi:hypothetical protein